MCTNCEYTWDSKKGDLEHNVPIGEIENFPDDWTCPQCGTGIENITEVLLTGTTEYKKDPLRLEGEEDEIVENYTKEEIDDFFYTKADIKNNYYAKDEIDESLSKIADKYYTKEEIDNLINSLSDNNDE